MSEEQERIDGEFQKFLQVAEAASTFFEQTLSELIERTGGGSVSASDIVEEVLDSEQSRRLQTEVREAFDDFSRVGGKLSQYIHVSGISTLIDVVQVYEEYERTGLGGAARKISEISFAGAATVVAAPVIVGFFLPATASAGSVALLTGLVAVGVGVAAQVAFDLLDDRLDVFSRDLSWNLGRWVDERARGVGTFAEYSFNAPGDLFFHSVAEGRISIITQDQAAIRSVVRQAADLDEYRTVSINGFEHAFAEPSGLLADRVLRNNIEQMTETSALGADVRLVAGDRLDGIGVVGPGQTVEDVLAGSGLGVLELVTRNPWLFDRGRIDFVGGRVLLPLGALLVEDAGNDHVLDGGQGPSFLHDANGGSDVLRGFGGGDTLVGGTGEDRLEGGADDDTLVGGYLDGEDDFDRDLLLGGAGNDRYLVGEGDVVADADSTGVLVFEDQVVDGEFEEIEQGRFLAQEQGRVARRVDADGDGEVDDLEVTEPGFFILDVDGGGLGIALHEREIEARAFPDGQSFTETDHNDLATSAGNLATRIFAGEGQDYLLGRLGDDEFHGEEGDDLLRGGHGADLLDGGPGRDILLGASDDDELRGGPDHDVITGDIGDDLLLGEAGPDIIGGGEGSDRILGGPGDDVIRGDAALTVALPLGVFFKYEAEFEPDAWGLTARYDPQGRPVDPILNHIQWIQTAEHGDDVIFGGEGHDLIDGEGGNDILLGEDGNDSLRGQHGDDRLYGGAGDDSLDGDAADSAGDDLLSGGDGDDRLEGRSGRDRLYGGAGTDELFGGDEGDWLYGGAGADTLDGGEGDDVLAGGSGDDLIIAGAGADFIDGGVGHDTLAGGSGPDTYILRLGDGNDRILGAGTAQGNSPDILEFDADVRAETLRVTVDPLALAPEDLHAARSVPTSITLTYGRGGDSIVLQGYSLEAAESDLRVVLGDGVERSLFFSGAVTEGSPFADVIVGSPGVDHLVGGDGEDVILGNGSPSPTGSLVEDHIDGGAGDDVIVGRGTLIGGAGDDRIDGLGVIDAGTGDDVIVAHGQSTLLFEAGHGVDRVSKQFGEVVISLGAGIGSGDLGGARDGDDLVVHTGASDSIRLEGWYTGDAAYRLRLADGSEHAAPEFEGLVLSGEPVAPNLGPVANLSADTAQATEGVSFRYDLGADAITDPNPWDTLTFSVTDPVGEALPAWLRANLDGGVRLEGTPDAGDVGTLNLVVTATDRFGESARVDLAVTVSSPEPIDGNNSSNQLYGTAASDVIHGYGGKDGLYGNAGDDQLFGGSGSDEMHGGEGDDTFVISATESGLDQLGYDEATEDGFDTVRIDGISADEITYGYLNSFRYGGGIAMRWGVDLSRGVDIAVTGIEQYVIGGEVLDRMDVLVRIDKALGGDDDYFANFPRAEAGGLLFYADSDHWGLTFPGSAASDEMLAGNGDDVLFGFDGDDLLDAGGGNDALLGGGGDDRYLPGVGNDVIHETGGIDELVLPEGVLASDLVLDASGSDLRIGIGEGSSVTIHDWYESTDRHVESVRLFDGTVLALPDLVPAPDDGVESSSDEPQASGDAGDAAGGEGALSEDPDPGSAAPEDPDPDPEQAGGSQDGPGDEPDEAIEPSGRILEGTDRDDWLTGTSRDDWLHGAAGDDRLNGYAGDDLYRFEAGDGNDEVVETGGTDRAVLEDAAPLDVALFQERYNLVLSYGESDRIEFRNWFRHERYQVEIIETGDGAVLPGSQVEQLVEAMAGFIDGQGAADWQDAVERDPAAAASLVATYWEPTVGA